MASRAAFFVNLTSLALAVLVASVPSVRSAEGSGTFVVIADLHFNPFDPPELATALAMSAPAAWQAIFASAQGSGDVADRRGHQPRAAGLGPRRLRPRHGERGLRHRAGRFSGARLQAKAADGAWRRSRSPAVADMATKTTLFVADPWPMRSAASLPSWRSATRIRAAATTRSSPAGRYLAATRETVRRLVGAERLEADFAETWAAAGYYAARHPTVANGLIVVLNDVLWSTQYRDACGSHGLAAAAGHDELAQRAAGAATRGRRPGLDGASHPLGDRCLLDDQRQGPVLSGEGRSVPEGAVRFRASALLWNTAT